MEFNWLFLQLCKLQNSDPRKTYHFMYFFTYLVLTLINLSLKVHQTDRVMKLADLEHVLVTKGDKEMFLQM